MNNKTEKTRVTTTRHRKYKTTNPVTPGRLGVYPGVESKVLTSLLKKGPSLTPPKNTPLPTVTKTTYLSGGFHLRPLRGNHLLCRNHFRTSFFETYPSLLIPGTYGHGPVTRGVSSLVSTLRYLLYTVLVPRGLSSRKQEVVLRKGSADRSPDTRVPTQLHTGDST